MIETPITNEEICSLLVTHTEQVFSLMLGVGVSPRSTAIQQNLDGVGGGIIALVGFAGKWNGAGSLSCGSDLACQVTSKMLMAEFHAVDEQVLDVIGELTNMIIGNFKNSAESLLGPLGMSTPTVFHGRDFHARTLNGQLWTSVAFECEGKTLEVRVCLAPSPHGKNAPHPSLLGPATARR